MVVVRQEGAESLKYLIEEKAIGLGHLCKLMPEQKNDCNYSYVYRGLYFKVKFKVAHLRNHRLNILWYY